MLECFDDYGYCAEFTGFRNVTFEAADAYLKANRKGEQKVWIQFFNADLIATKEHLYFAVLNALAAFKNHTNLSKSLAMETMLYTASERQIQKAIQAAGIKPYMTETAVVIIGEKPEQVKTALNELALYLKAEPCDAVLELTPKKASQIKQVFNITPQMVKAVAKGGNEDAVLAALVIERSALLATEF